VASGGTSEGPGSDFSLGHFTSALCFIVQKWGFSAPSPGAVGEDSGFVRATNQGGRATLLVVLTQPVAVSLSGDQSHLSLVMAEGPAFN
jgi:hypothetical protein